MKFLCPSCKAKYQIADEKVAGRSVRMKCRKCGQEIRVSSADAIANSSAPPPSPDEVVAETGNLVSVPNVAEKPAPSPAAVRAPNKPAVAGATASPAAPRPLAPTATATPSPASATATPSPASAAAGGAGLRPPPRPLGAALGKAGALSRPVGRNATAVTHGDKALAEKPNAADASPGSDRLAEASKPASVAKPTVAARNAAPIKAATGDKPANKLAQDKAAPDKAGSDKAARPLAPSTLGAKRAAVKVETKPEPKPEPAGPPSGPRDEEFNDEEQTRIAEFGALAGAFNAAVSASHHQPAHQISDPLTMPGDEWFVGINGVPVGPIRLSELRSKASLGSVTKESLVWRDGFEEWRALKSFPELVAIVEEGLSSAIASGMPLTRLPVTGASPEAISDPFGATVPQPSVTTTAAVTGAAVVTDDLDAAGLRPRRGAGKAAWIAVVVALFFGISLGFVVFSRKPAEIVRYVEVPAKGTEPAPQAPAAQNDAVIPETAVPGKEAKNTGKTSGTAKPQPTTTKPEETGTKLGRGLSGLGAGVTPGGPGGESGPSGAGAQLESGQVQQVVSRYTPSVKRSCWQPALDTRDKDAGSSARVVVSIQVAANGSVQNATTSGDPRGYRGLANCIAGRVRGWQFPPAGSSTTVNVPFVFVAQ